MEITTRSRLIGCVGIGLLGVAALPGAALAQDGGVAVSRERTVLNRYCVRCHNERLRTADLTLDAADVDHVSEAPEIWEKVVRKLRTRAMPPATETRRPSEADYDSLASTLEAALDRAAVADPRPGRPTIHRLNRTEYANAIRDLFSLEIDATTFLPADSKGEGGFTNNADALSITPVLLERYLSAAARVGRLAIGDVARPPGVETYRLSRLMRQDVRVDENLPFGSRGGTVVLHNFPRDGEYLIKVRMQVSRQGGENIRALNEENVVDVRIDGTRVGQFTIGGAGGSSYVGDPDAAERPEIDARTADDHMEVRIPVKAGPHQVAVSFVKNRSALPEGVGPSQWPIASYAYDSGSRGIVPMAVDTVQIGGPYGGVTPKETPSRQRIFVCRPVTSQEEAPCARTIVSSLARRAFRRTVGEADVAALLTFYEAGRAEAGFDGGIRRAIEAMLVDPEFLFRIETDPPNATADSVHRVSDVEFASRLSFFLWSSIPDDELLDLATEGRLGDAVVVEQQVRRMLRDDRARAFVENFFGEWLLVKNVEASKPDGVQFPEFDDNLREAFKRETALFLESQLREDSSALELLSADYTFLNERLAKHYGIPNVYGSQFRRVSLRDERRHGLLGQGSVLMVTSYPARTSPVLRGKYLLDNFFGAPPPPPPPNVDTDLSQGEGDKPRSLRDRLEQHRRNPVCAGCHARMDPLGFSLENFDAVGAWRTSDAGTTIDPSGRLVDGTVIDGVAGLRKVLLDRPETFVTALTEKLLTYALGRGLSHHDAPAVRQIVRRAAVNDYSWSSLILELVTSTPFQFRMSS